MTVEPNRRVEHRLTQYAHYARWPNYEFPADDMARIIHVIYERPVEMDWFDSGHEIGVHFFATAEKRVGLRFQVGGLTVAEVEAGIDAALRHEAA